MQVLGVGNDNEQAEGRPGREGSARGRPLEEVREGPMRRSGEEAIVKGVEQEFPGQDQQLRWLNH